MTALLQELGRSVRAERQRRGWTQRTLAERSGLSQRFLAQLEAGQANISLERLAQLARVLEVPVAAMIDPALRGPQAQSPERDGALRGIVEILQQRSVAELKEVRRWLEARFAKRTAPVVALLGLRGAGKSTVGAELAERLGLRFVELDAEIERAAGLSLGEIFELHGGSYYRRLEREVMMSLLADPGGVVMATGGGLVTERETFRLLRRRAVTVWLKARPEDHWNRVIQQGDQRPMAKNPQAMQELRALLAAREKLYSEAEIVVDTSQLGVEGTVERLAHELKGFQS